MSTERVTREEKELELLQKAKVLYITGHINQCREIAYLLERRFLSAGILSMVIDNEVLSNGLCQNCKNDNLEFSRRTIEAAKLFINSGIIAICYGVDDSIDYVNNIVEKSDFILITTNKYVSNYGQSFAIEIGTNSIEDVVHDLYKKLANTISQ